MSIAPIDDHDLTRPTITRNHANISDLTMSIAPIDEVRDLTRPTITRNHVNEFSDLTMTIAPIDEADENIDFTARPAYRGPLGKAIANKPVAQRNLMKGIDELPEPENIQVVRTHPMMRDISEMSMSFALI
jgi:hypothetical protein